MKNKLQIIWFCLLMLFFIYFSVDWIKSKWLATNFTKIEHVTLATFDTIEKESGRETIILSIGDVECTPCNVFFKDKYVLDNSISPYYFEIKTNDSSKLIRQALRTDCFPTSYVFDNKFSLLGKVEGIRDFHKRLKNVIHVKEVDINVLMFRFALKSLLSYWANDFSSAESFASKSLEQGSYFFNNYMMYLLAKPIDYEKAEFYRKTALSYNTKVDIAIYDDLIHKLNTN